MGGYATEVGARLRGIRRQQGLSLHDVERTSGGRWKGVVVGSYERGDRAVTVRRLAELAEFYGVATVALMPEGRVAPAAEPATPIVIDLERVGQLPVEQAGPLARYVATIQRWRGHDTARVLAIRTEDLRGLAVVYDMPPVELTEWLTESGVLPPGSRTAGAG